MGIIKPYKDTLVYDGYIKVYERKTDGVKREYIVQGSGDAVAVAIMNATKDKMLLVRQYRAPIGRYIWEIPAGMVDVEGECLSDCMIREIKEETNLDLESYDLTCENGFYPNVGISQHKITLFSALLKEGIKETEGEIVGDDVVLSKWFSMKEIEDMIKSEEIVDLKTMYAISLMKSKYSYK